MSDLCFGAKATDKTPPITSVPGKAFHLHPGEVLQLSSPLYRDGHYMDVSVGGLSAVPPRC